MTAAGGHSTARGAPAAAPAPRLGALQALAANVAGVVMNLCLKLVAALPASEIIVLRSVVALVPLALLHLRDGGRVEQVHWRAWPAALWIRAGCEAAATLFVVIAVTRTSLALVTAMSLTIPILVSLIGVFVFRERADARVWAGIGLGLGGSLLVLQPTMDATPVGVAAAAAAAVAYAARDSVTLHMPARYGSVLLTLASNVATLILGVALAVEGGWRLPSPTEGQILGLAIAAYIASNILVTVAVRNAGLVLSGVFRYATIPTALALDYALFRTVPTGLALAGTGMVILGGLVVIAAVARLQRRRVGGVP